MGLAALAISSGCRLFAATLAFRPPARTPVLCVTVGVVVVVHDRVPVDRPDRRASVMPGSALRWPLVRQRPPAHFRLMTSIQPLWGGFPPESGCSEGGLCRLSDPLPLRPGVYFVRRRPPWSPLVYGHSA
jgi:hypothetical protein